MLGPELIKFERYFYLITRYAPNSIIYQYPETKLPYSDFPKPIYQIQFSKHPKSRKSISRKINNPKMSKKRKKEGSQL